MARIPPSMSIETEMECGRKEVVGSQTLQRIAEQLQWYKTPSLIEELENVTGRNMGSKFGIMDHVEGENGLFTHANWRKRRAAVLICLFEGKQGELRVILTKRSMKLSSHPGDVALPGGKMEEGDDDDSATALREAMEEIGLDSYLVQVVAKLEPFISQNQLRVVPVVGLLAKIEDFSPVLNCDEVDAVFDVPLEMFLKVDNHRCEERAWKSWKYVFHCFDCETEQGAFTICGLTASILIRAASVVYQQIPCFSSNLPDFQQLQRALSNAA
ncbi:PREDICTED: nudix hydrolase 15, mitochondrial isoform X1 [Theobroma cacao]|uniref:Nudix hydrolase 15, mitochondrial isoform X1 n=1 Tax=Theobroma cacao TaxID=3641 RepID=A0AB32WBT5_THECC|nr:PREDICTED: nudix hydrolase 15, mitochondrial isoform X1 [Theobroma cacao]XP_017977329.1 PREDICTED: nudix hydrolase 15, mitochondrial isoform X1 [Theobroma cacao]